MKRVAYEQIATKATEAMETKTYQALPDSYVFLGVYQNVLKNTGTSLIYMKSSNVKCYFFFEQASLHLLTFSNK